MTSIQLPPLQFEDGGFRVSIITGGSGANASSSSEANPVAEPEPTPQPEIKPQELEAKPPTEQELKTPTQANPEPARIRTPPPKVERKPVRKPVSSSEPEEPQLESEPESKSPESVSRINSQYQLAPTRYQQPDQINIQLEAYSESDNEASSELEAVPFKIESDVQPARPTSDATEGSYVNDMPERKAPSPPPASVPSHPIESLQRAFAESLDEVTKGGAIKPNLREVDAKARRERLLEQGKEDAPHDARWRYRPGQTQHEVLKLISQISFGVYLLLNGMANDNAQVVSILQGHIDEVDEYLEVTLEDIGQAATDLNERIDYLKLPMSNMKVFEEMLEDRNYRAEILEGNEKIEQVLARMNVVMKQWDNDVDSGLHGATAFMDWLNTLKNGQWRHERPDLEEIFDAMKGNADGWLNAFDEMNSRTQDMNSVIIKLMTLVAELEKKAGEISRKTWSTIPPFTSPKSGSLKSRTSVSTPRSVQSNAKSATRVSVKSGSASIAQQSLAEGDEDDGLDDFPLPGVTPLLPPTRSSARLSKKPSVDAPKLRLDTVPPKPSPVRETVEEEKEDGPLYILQPRTYTPQPPEPLPSPRVRESPKSPPSARHQPERESNMTNTRSSIRHRVSLKKSIPESLRISSNHSLNRPDSRPSPVFTSPRQSNNTSFLRDSASSHLQVRDSSSSSIPARDSNGSDIEAFRQHNLPRVASHAELGPVRPSLMQSPNSDYQHYHPVRASPHSPLQQRPHTAAGPQSRQPSGYFPQHLRGQPSRLGSMATLDSIAAAENPDNRTVRQGAPSVGGSRSVGGKTLKKKKSAFGWFKKAFTMDDEERAAFEARKNAYQADNYYKDKSPKFLDGKRMR